jgi:hypothetical protein
MKSKTACLLLGFVCGMFCAPVVSRDNPPDYSQTYAILIKESMAGTETVTETLSNTGDRVSVSEHDIQVTDGLQTKRMAFSTKMVLSKGTLDPKSYTYRYTSGDGGDSYDVVIKNEQATRTLRRGDHLSDVTVPWRPDMVILDFNVYHQYDYLLRKYDNKRGGRQTFADFIPLLGNDIPIALAFLGDSTLDLGKRKLAVRNYRIEFVGIWSGTVSADKNGRLVRLLIPNQDLEVVRKDLLDEISKSLSGE